MCTLQYLAVLLQLYILFLSQYTEPDPNPPAANIATPDLYLQIYYVPEDLWAA